MKKFHARFRVVIALTVLGLVLAGFIWNMVFTKTSTPTPPPCCSKTPTITPTPPSVEQPPVVVNPVPVPSDIKADAWCDHMPVWTENPNRRHVLIFSFRDDIEINLVEFKLVETRSDVNLDTSFSMQRVSPNKMHVYGAFPEDIHGAELEVTVYYTIKAKFGIRFLHKSVVHCVVKKTS